MCAGLLAPTMLSLRRHVSCGAACGSRSSAYTEPRLQYSAPSGLAIATRPVGLGVAAQDEVPP